MFKITFALCVLCSAVPCLAAWEIPAVWCATQVSGLPDKSQLATRRNQIEDRLGSMEEHLFERSSYMQLVARAGFPIDPTTLTALGIPPEAHSFYNRRGEFHYSNPNPFRLALENGTYPFQSFRIVARASDLTSPARTPLDDYLNLLTEAPDISLSLALTPFDENHNQLVSTSKAQSQFEARRSAILGARQQELSSRLVAYIANVPLHPWATDDSKQIGNNRFLISYKPQYGLANLDRATRNNIKEMGTRNQYEIVRSLFLFEGGDILVGNRHVFVGWDTILKNKQLYRVSEQEILRALSSEFGKDVVYLNLLEGIPTEGYDFFMNTFPHLDLHVMVVADRSTGEDVILMSSPQRAIDALRGHANDPVSRELSRAIRASSAANTIWEMVNRRYQTQLEQLNYSVRTLPGLSFPHMDRVAAREAGSPHSTVYSVNYVNAHAGGDLLIAPASESPILNEIVNAEFTRLGYRTAWQLSARESVSENNGGSRCFANAMRSYPQ